MAIKVGINGFGRIGRMVFRAAVRALSRHRDRRHQRPARARLSGLHAAVRLRARPLQGRRSRVDGNTLIVNGKQDPPDRGQGPGRAEVGRSRRRRRRRVHRPVPRPRTPRRSTSRPARRRSSCRRRRRTTRRCSSTASTTRRYAGPGDHLERVVHDQLPRAGRQGAERQLGHQARPDDDGARRDRDAEDRRRPVEQGLARRPRHPREHHSVVDRRGQGRRQGHSGAQQEADRHGVPRADLGRLRRRPDRRAAQGSHLRADLRRDEGAPRRAR